MGMVGEWTLKKNREWEVFRELLRRKETQKLSQDIHVRVSTYFWGLSLKGGKAWVDDT
jgi:hypothetical protein